MPRTDPLEWKRLPRGEDGHIVRPQQGDEVALEAVGIGS